jgi:hypothetical protein
MPTATSARKSSPRPSVAITPATPLTTPLMFVASCSRSPSAAPPLASSNRAYPWVGTKLKIQEQAKANNLYNPDTGNYIDPNTGLEIEEEFHYGHTTGNESWRSRDEATKKGMSQSEYNKSQQNSEYWQIEDPKTNMSHKYEQK